MEWLIRYGRVESVPGYDCKTSDHKNETTNYGLGVASLIFGATAEVVILFIKVLYMLNMMVMVKKRYRSLPCYKIMIALGKAFAGIYDMGAIFVTSILTGYFWMVGAEYCNNPTSMYIAGALANAFFYGACMNTLILIVNRLLNLRNKSLMQKIFKGNRTYVVLLMPLLYALYFCFYTHPVLFNSNNCGWFFFTFAPNHKPENYYNYSQIVNNLLVMTMNCTLALWYYRSVSSLSDAGNGLPAWARKSLFIQCAVIWSYNIAFSLVHIYIQFFHKPSYLVLIAHVGWQLGHVLPALIYLLFNSTIRREVLLLFSFRGDQRIWNRSNPITI